MFCYLNRLVSDYSEFLIHPPNSILTAFIKQLFISLTSRHPAPAWHHQFNFITFSMICFQYSAQFNSVNFSALPSVQIPGHFAAGNRWEEVFVRHFVHCRHGISHKLYTDIKRTLLPFSLNRPLGWLSLYSALSICCLCRLLSVNFLLERDGDFWLKRFFIILKIK